MKTMSLPPLDCLRVLVADRRRLRGDETAAVLDALGHAVVGIGQNAEDALRLISEIVRIAACPVIIDLDAEDPALVDQAATRGAFAYVKHGQRNELESTLCLVMRRYAELTRVRQALGRQAVIEQAKGILMERHALSARQAFEDLRQHARNTNQTVYDVAQAVTLSYPLLRSPPASED